jgi:hypothetical protein
VRRSRVIRCASPHEITCTYEMRGCVAEPRLIWPGPILFLGDTAMHAGLAWNRYHLQLQLITAIIEWPSLHLLIVRRSAWVPPISILSTNSKLRG